MKTITSDDQIRFKCLFTDFILKSSFFTKYFALQKPCQFWLSSSVTSSSVSIINTELIPTYEIKLMTEKFGMLDNKYRL